MPDDIATRPTAPAQLRAAPAPSTWNPDRLTVDVVFTTGAAENPTLTIVALAIRQADHIASEMAAGNL